MGLSMALTTTLLVLANLASFVSAHTQIYYPVWRNNSFNAPFSQQIYPCAGISDTADIPRTPWPLTGGSLNVTFHDSAAIIFVNLGLGSNATNFNISLLAQPLNDTGAGNLCFPQLTLPAGLPIHEGTNATIQLATSNPKNGEGLYNCADIVFTSNATLLPSSQCQNSSTMTVNPLFSSSSTSSGAGGSTPSSSAPASTSTTAKSLGVQYVTPPFIALLLSSVVALAL